MGLLKSLVVAGDCVADVGANVGAYTMELSHLVGSAGNVYSFEPISENYDILQAVIRKAELSNVCCFRAALGSVRGKCEMVVPDSRGFVGFYLAHRARPGDSGQRTRVEVLTLDDLRKTNIITRLDFVKCDVEGGELDVILGGQHILQSDRPGWLTEVSRPTSGEVFYAFHDLGYRAFVFEGRLLFETTSYRDKEFSNYFFFHPQSASWNRAAPLMATS
jgi:FkbM family methyltransferase